MILKGPIKVIGIDYSYTSPAICILGEDFQSSQFFFANINKKVCVKARNYEGTLIPKDWKDTVERYEFLSQWAIDFMRPFVSEETEIKLEGYAYSSRAGQLFDIAENAGLLKYHIKKAFGKFPTIVAPTTAKKQWTGKGNANKELMVETLKEKEGIDIVEWLAMNRLQSPAHDVVDSYAIAKVV